MDKPLKFALVQGASRGLGLELARQLVVGGSQWKVFASCRDPGQAGELEALRRRVPERLEVLALDVTREETIEAAAEQFGGQTDHAHLVINVAGVLHGPTFHPEKKLAHVEPEALRAVFEVNTFGPLLVAKHFHRFLRHGERSVFASLSARVGSISDNRLGGWYAYRSSKAAQNMVTKTLSIELGRVAPRAIVVGLHPGTVDTKLSKPFQGAVPDDKLFSPAYAADALLRTIDGLDEEHSGRVFDYAGKEVPP